MDGKIIGNSIPVKVQFRHMTPSNSIRELVRAQAERLRRFGLGGGRCEVVIDESNHWHRGRIFKVAIRLTVPGKRVFTAQTAETCDCEEYLDPAVRLAFDEIERQLEKRRKRSRRREARELAA
jgi:ribosome-associated translation inhibitor RaiA